MSRHFCAMPVEMTSEDKTKKGNMEGISIVRHMKSPSEAAFDISGANRISPMLGAITAIFAQLGVFIAGAYFALNGYGLTPGAVILFVNLMNFTIEPIASLPGLLAGRKAALGLVDKLARACCIMFPPGLRRARHMP